MLTLIVLDGVVQWVKEDPIQAENTETKSEVEEQEESEKEQLYQKDSE